jgi:hypothetical protein
MQAPSGLRARSAVAIVVAVCAALLAVPVGVSLLTHRPPKLTPKNLTSSVGDQVRFGGFHDGCVHVQGVRWNCWFSNGSSEASYVVEMTSARCWVARGKPPSEADAPTTASGCL